MKRIYISALLILACFCTMKADEGIWLLPGVPDSILYKYEEIGCELESSDFYSEKDPSLKDNTLYLSNGYSATLMSQKGLLLTTYSAVRQYIPDSMDISQGFYAEDYDKEIPLGNLYALKLISAENLKNKIDAEISTEDDDKTIRQKTDSVCELERLFATDAPFIVADIKNNGKGDPVLYKYVRYPDLRLAYLPPTHLAEIMPDSIAGVVTSHDADFAFIRIYANPEMQPAVFDSTNIAAEFEHCATISVNGYDEGEIVFSMGYPNNSKRNTTGAALTETSRIKDKVTLEVSRFFDSLRREDHSTERLVIENRLKYLKKQKTILKKTAEEDSFTVWAANHPDFDIVLRYANAIPISRLYYERRANAAENYFRLNEIINRCRMLSIARMIDELTYENETYILPEISEYFTHFDPAKERECLNAALNYISNKCDSIYQPDIFQLINEKYKGRQDKFLDKLFAKSFTTAEKRFVIYIDDYNSETSENDLMMQLYRSIRKSMQTAYAYYILDDGKINRYESLYNEGLILEMPERTMKPDANFTLRMSTGKIEGYVPSDGILVQYATNPTAIPDIVQLRTADSAFIRNNDKLRSIKCNFLCSCDIPGEKQGHGIYDIRGELLGISHGNNAEAVISEYSYDLNTNRSFAVDMDYILFFLSDYSKADNIYDELQFGEVEQTISIQYAQAAISIPLSGDSIYADSAMVGRYALITDSLLITQGNDTLHIANDTLVDAALADSIKAANSIIENMNDSARRED